MWPSTRALATLASALLEGPPSNSRQVMKAKSGNAPKCFAARVYLAVAVVGPAVGAVGRAWLDVGLGSSWLDLLWLSRNDQDFKAKRSEP